MGSIDSEPEIPTVDISPFTQNASAEEKQRTAREFAEKCSRSGCLRITGHGMPLDVIRKNFELTERFYKLPLEDKKKAPHPDDFMPHRGYSGIGGEKAAPKKMYDQDAEGNKILSEDGHFKNIDFKETWDMGSEDNDEQQNIYLPEEVLPGFREIMTELYWRLAETGWQLLEVMIAGLELNEAEAKAIRDLHVSGHYNHLRTLHYLTIPAGKAWSKDESRLGAHTDLNSFTFGFQDNRGIEFLDRKTDTWVPAVAEEGALYLNIADMMTRLSNGHYPGGMHRVSLPPPDAKESVPERHSIVYFVGTSFNVPIETPESLVERHGSTVKYPTTTLGQYVKDALY